MGVVAGTSIAGLGSARDSAITDYAAARKWTVYAEYVDAGWSGAKASRPALNRHMAEARKRRFDAVLCWKVDRWGRSVADSIKNIQELEGTCPCYTLSKNGEGSTDGQA